MADDTKFGISFSMKRRRVLIYRSTLRCLGQPQSIRFLLNMKCRRVAVQACEIIDRDSFKVPQYENGSKDQYEITSISFLNMIYKIAEWNLNQTYRIYGTSYPGNRLVEFDLEDAEVIQDEEFIDPGLTE